MVIFNILISSQNFLYLINIESYISTHTLTWKRGPLYHVPLNTDSQQCLQAGYFSFDIE